MTCPQSVQATLTYLHRLTCRICAIHGPAGMLTLWQAMTGGVDWASVVTPLLEPGPAMSAFGLSRHEKVQVVSGK